MALEKDGFMTNYSKDPYIFISYSHKDSERVIPILRTLHDAGYRLWYDEGIPWTSEWPKEIAIHLANCHVCIAFHSIESIKSEYCRKEIHFALSQEKPILSAFLDDISLPLDLSFELSIYQQVKLYKYSNDNFLNLINVQPAFTACRVTTMAEQTTSHEWHCNNDILWTVQGETLLIDKVQNSGGRIPNFDWDKKKDRALTPWRKEREDVRAIIIKDGITSIGNRAFRDFPNLLEVSIPESVTSVGIAAFRNCPCLTSITIPDTVSSIGGNAFNDCSGLRELSIPSSITYIKENTFSDCESLTKVCIPSGVQGIGWNAFFSCTSLFELIIPNTVDYIGDNAFRSCVRLTNITIPDSVIYIGSRAFYGCTGLERIEVSAKTKIGRLAFPDNTHIIRRPVK